MKSKALVLAAAFVLCLAAFATQSSATVATPSSSCKVHCGNGLYGGQSGGTWQDCLNLASSLCNGTGGNATYNGPDGSFYIAAPAPSTSPSVSPAGI